MNRITDELAVFVPGYGEDRDMVEQFRAALESDIDRKVFVPDLYRPGDRTRSGLPSRELAERLLRQLGLDEFPPGLVVVSHSTGARIAHHIPGKGAEAMLAPEGVRPGGIGLGVNFAVDTLRRLWLPAEGRAFTARQARNILSRPEGSARQAVEMMRTGSEPMDLELARRALIVAFLGDRVIPFEKLYDAVTRGYATDLVVLPGDHYEMLQNPDPVAAIVADYLKPENH